MSDTAAALHPRILELLAELERSRVELHSTVRSLSPEQRDAAPVGEEWSVAQILEHLAIVEDGVGRLVSRFKKAAQEAGAFEHDTSSVLGGLDRFDVSNPSRRIEAPPAVLPVNGLTTAEALDKLEAVRERFVSALKQASGLAIGTQSHLHPALGQLDGYQWVLMLAQHERRHVAQIRRIVAG